jgi:hypothetical protein
MAEFRAFGSTISPWVFEHPRRIELGWLMADGDFRGSPNPGLEMGCGGIVRGRGGAVQSIHGIARTKMPPAHPRALAARKNGTAIQWTLGHSPTSSGCANLGATEVASKRKATPTPIVFPRRATPASLVASGPHTTT